MPSDALRNRLLTGDNGYVPKDTLTWFNTPCEEGAYVGKKILALHGGVDQIMPFKLGAEKYPQIRKEAVSEVYVDENFGHVVTREMVRRTAEWMWRWGLTEAK